METNKVADIVATVSAVFLLFLAAINFAASGAELFAYQWPLLDMFPFFLIKTGEASLSSDFFSQCSVLPSPRYIYGYFIIILSNISHLHWYGVLTILNILIGITLPAITFLATYAISRPFLPPQTWTYIALIQAFMVSLVTLSDKVLRFFAIAWWPPFYFQPTPHTISLTVGMLALGFWGYQKVRVASFLLICSLLIHPTVGLSVAIVEGIALFLFSRWKQLTVLAILVVLSLGFILITFNQSSSLTTSEFVNIYAFQRHPHHYIPSKFSSLLPLISWQFAFGTVVSILSASMIYLRITSSNKAAKLILFFLLFYMSSLLMQYLGVEVFPIKSVATLGPSRFLLWGYWLCTIGVSLSIGHALSTYFDKHKLRNDLVHFRHPVAIAVFLLVAAITLWMGIRPIFPVWINLVKAHTLTSIPEERNGAILHWIELNSSENSVFIAPPDSSLKLDIPIATHRGIFIGNGFPFNESCFKEYSERSTLTERNLNGDLIDYDSKDYDYFKGVSGKIKADYVIVSPYQGEQLFLKHQPVFQTEEYWIYSLN